MEVSWLLKKLNWRLHILFLKIEAYIKKLKIKYRNSYSKDEKGESLGNKFRNNDIYLHSSDTISLFLKNKIRGTMKIRKIWFHKKIFDNFEVRYDTNDILIKIKKDNTEN